MDKEYLADTNLIRVTRNEDDFKDVETLEIYNPFR